MPSRRAALLGTVLLMGLIAAGVTLWRLVGPAPLSPDERRRQIVYADSERVYNSIRMTGAIATTDEVWSILENAPVEGEDALAPGEKALLLDTVSTFIALRFGNNDPAAYRQWRTERGDVMRSEDDLISQLSIDFFYEKMTGKNYTKGHDLGGVFDDLWKARREMRAGFNRLDAIAADPKGLSIVVGLATPSGGVRVAGELTPDQWYGGATSFHHSWFMSGSTYVGEQFGSGQPVVTAQVGFITQFGAGPRRPMTLQLFWVEPIGRWVPGALSTHGRTAGTDKLYAIDY